MKRASLFAAGLLVAGCTSVGGSAVRTGPVRLPAYSGPVAVYALGQPPAGAVDLGIVEVHAAQQEATVDTLLPQFVRKVAEIGGNVALVEGTRARFDVAGRTHYETFYYACGMATCAGTRVYNTTDEIMVVSMFGHAMTTQTSSGPPLIPPGPPPPPPPQEDGEGSAPSGADLGEAR